MSTQPLAPTAARSLMIAIGMSFGLPAFAQNDMQGMNMKGMDMQNLQMPATKSPPQRRKRKPSAPARAKAAGGAASKQGNRMQGMDMSSMHGMQMPAGQPAKAAPAPAPASSSVSGQSTQSMQGMEPKSQPAEMQHLHFGNMIGVRPKPGGLATGSQGMQMSSMQNMKMGPMQGGAAPPDARSADYSDGYRYTDMPGMAMSDHAKLGMLLLDQFEYAHDNHGLNSAFLDGQFWYGEDFNKLWLKAEGEYATGKLQDLRTEALWDHAISTYWGTQLGVRQDSGPGRTWAALGIQGLAPYWFDTEATLYVGQNGRTAARVEFEYEALLTQRVVLQPKIEANLYGKDDPQRGIGSGLSDTEIALRLRYEFKREFGPYVGVVWRERYGRTADFARAQGEPAGDLQFVAGLHVWF